MTSPTDPPQTLKEGRSTIIQRGGQTGAGKRVSAEEVWRAEESSDTERSRNTDVSLVAVSPINENTQKKQKWVPAVGGRED